MKARIGLIALFAMFILLINGGYMYAQVEPLTQTRWSHHSAPFNNLLPMDGSNRSIAGCVVSATAQIMKYHRHPVRGNGQSEQYTTRTRGFQIPSVNFNIAYDWNNMLNTYTGRETAQQQNAVATLFYYLAVSMNTDFTSSYSSQGGAIAPLTNFFGYDRSIEGLHRSYFNNDTEWEAILRAQLDAGLPVLYGGRNAQGGGSHFFVVDGYDNSGRFHINMGYGGRADGWYFLNDIRYGGQDHSYQQSMDINIKPNQGGTGTNRMALINFTPAKTTVSINERFNVTIQMRGVGYFSGGQAGVALVDNRDNILAVIGSRSNPERRPNGVTGVWEIGCTVPNTIAPGSYKLRIVIRPTNGEWQIITLSEVGNGVPTSIDFTVR